MEEDFITVKVFAYPSEVPIVQSFMEMNGIEVFMKNLTTHRTVYPIDDIEMQVKTSDYARAKEILIEGGFATVRDFE